MKDSQSKKTKKRLFKKKKLNPKKIQDKVLPLKKKPQKENNSDNFFKKHEHDLLFVLIPVILLILLFIIYSINKKVSSGIKNYRVVSVNSEKIAPYPVAQNAVAPKITAKAGIILDADSQKIILSKNQSLRFSMASTVKIMTALVALDYYKPNSILTIKSSFVEGSGLGLQVGDKFYFDDLLYAMMLPSANDAAQAISDNYPGGQVEFVKMMNLKAGILHLEDTHYSDSIGLNDDGDYSTVVDTARLGSYAIKNKEFAKVVATPQRIIGNIYKSRQYNISNLNKLLGFRGVNGIKTGTTEGAGEVLVTSAIENGHEFIIVVMNSQNRFRDTEALLDFAEQNVDFIVPDAVSGVSK